MNIKISKKIAIVLILIFAFTICSSPKLMASDKINPEDYKTTLTKGEASYIFEKGGAIIRILRNIAAIMSVVVISIIGIRYMVGSVEQKAEYKETMKPVLIGCIMVGGLASILTLIQSAFQ